jgi:hypothetical protein
MPLRLLDLLFCQVLRWLALVGVLLRYLEPGHAEAATWTGDHMATASSSNATASRRCAGSSIASS